MGDLAKEIGEGVMKAFGGQDRDRAKANGEKPFRINGLLTHVDAESRTGRIEWLDEERAISFAPDLLMQLPELVGRTVWVTGSGRFEADGTLACIDVDDVEEGKWGLTPSEFIELQARRGLMKFDPDALVRSSEPFDVDEFLETIYEARGRSWKESKVS